MSITTFQKLKDHQEKISMITCYDYISAKTLAATNIDALLVGDTLAMLMYGHSTTVPATVEMMTLHIKAVVKGAPKKFVIGDMPFLSYRKGLLSAMNTVEKLMQAGAQAIKLEGANGNLKLIQHIVESGIPVMGHIGMTPQAINQLGGFRLQGKDEPLANKIFAEALALEEAGCFSVVLECMPTQLAQKITKALRIPTIGIGAGPYTDGQILVFHDLLGLNPEFKPKFLKTYLNGESLILEAIQNYLKEVKKGIFPSKTESY
jgi:3-methyl-2-oxobutanoate hydroxymethyltransferase